MKQAPARKSLFAILTIFTVMLALIVPAPVYAAGPSHEPPPPKPPTNDLGKKDKPDKSSPASVGDLPAGTTVVVTVNGTSQPLASLLSVRALSAGAASPANPVKFCKGSNPGFYGDCTAYASIQEAIDAVANLRGSASGVFYVAVDYPKPVNPPYTPPFQPNIVLDQSSFFHPDAATNLNMWGGYIFSGSGAGTQSGHLTELVQPFSIQNINQDSSFSLNNFDLLVYDTLYDDPSQYFDQAVVKVADSHNVTLSNLTITSFLNNVNNALDISNSEQVSVEHSKIYANGYGHAIRIDSSKDVRLKDVYVDQEGFLDAIEIESSGERASAGYLAGSDSTWDPSITLEDVFVNVNTRGRGVEVGYSDHVLIKDSTFISHLGPYSPEDNAYPAVAIDDCEYVTLDNVAAYGNESGDGIDISGASNILLNKVVAKSDYKGVSIFWSSGSLTITNSHFDGNGWSGLYVESYFSNIYVGNTTANSNGHVPDNVDDYDYDYLSAAVGAAFTNGYRSLLIENSQFDQNVLAGVWVEDHNVLPTMLNSNSAGVVIPSGVTLDNIEANANGSYGGVVFGRGQVHILDSQFDENGADGLVAVSNSLVSLSGVQADHNANFGAGLFNELGFLAYNPLQYPLSSRTVFDPPTSNYPLVNPPDKIEVYDSTFSGNGWGGVVTLLASGRTTPTTVDNLASGEDVDLGNYINLENVAANYNGGFGVQSSILSYESNFRVDINVSGKSLAETINIGNFIRMEDVTANGNQYWGVLANIHSENMLRFPEPNLPKTTSAEGIGATDTFNRQVELNANIGNFITLDRVKASKNGEWGVGAQIQAVGASQNTINLVDHINLTDWVMTPADEPASLVQDVTYNTQVTLTSGNQIKIGDVVANDNGQVGLDINIYSGEDRRNTINANASLELTGVVLMQTGKGSLVSNNDESMLLTLISGNQISLDGVVASGNQSDGVLTEIHSEDSLNNTISVLSLGATITNDMEKQKGHGNLDSQSRIDLQTYLISGNQIDLTDVKANQNLLGIAADIKSGQWTEASTTNTIIALLESKVDNDIFGDGENTITFDDKNSVTANILSGARINLDGVQANDNLDWGILNLIDTDETISNLLSAQISFPFLSINQLDMSYASGHMAATRNEAVDASITSANQINLHNVKANRNFSLCSSGEECGFSSAIMADIIAKDVVANSLIPTVGSGFWDYARIRYEEDKTGSLSTETTNNLLAAIHSGNLISLIGVTADTNGLSGIAANIDSSSSYTNTIRNIDSALISFGGAVTQTGVGDLNPTSTVHTRVANSLQALLDSGNTISMQDVHASSNAGSGVSAVIEANSGTTINILDGTLFNSFASIATHETGNVVLKTNISNDFIGTIFNDDRIELNDIKASSNGGNGISALISAQDTRQDMVTLTMWSDRNNVTFVNNGHTSLAVEDVNYLWADTSAVNAIDLTDSIASFNTWGGVNANIYSTGNHTNTTNLVNFYNNGVLSAGVYDGTAALASDLVHVVGGSVVDASGIRMADVVASGNGWGGVYASIASFNQEVNNLAVLSQIVQVNEINFPDESFDFQTAVTGSASTLVDSVNFIDLSKITANQNGENGIYSSIYSDESVSVTADAGLSTWVLYMYNGQYVEASPTNLVTETTDTQRKDIDTIDLKYVTANHNALSGTILSGDAIDVENSTFMYNGRYGLELHGDSRLVNVRACHNLLGPLEQYSGSLFTDNLDTLVCPETIPASAAPAGGTEPEAAGLPWQIIKVYMDPGQKRGTLSCQFGTTYLYLEKQAAPAPDFEWARAVLAPCLVPGGSVGAFTGLVQGGLPGPLPAGVAWLGKAFDFTITGAGGMPVGLGGAMSLRFTLPGGFTLPAGKQLAILWFDPGGKQWVELPTYAGGQYASAAAASTGAFVLVIE